MVPFWNILYNLAILLVFTLSQSHNTCLSLYCYNICTILEYIIKKAPTVAGRLPSPPELKRYYTLLALASEPLHAYGIRARVIEDSSGSLYLSLVTLRRILNRFVSLKLVAVMGHYSAGSLDVPLYRIMPGGLRLLQGATADLEVAARHARKRL